MLTYIVFPVGCQDQEGQGYNGEVVTLTSVIVCVYNNEVITTACSVTTIR